MRAVCYLAAYIDDNAPLLALWLLDDAEVEVNDVLGEGDNITCIVGI